MGTATQGVWCLEPSTPCAVPMRGHSTVQGGAQVVASKPSENANYLTKPRDLNLSFGLLDKGSTSQNSGLSHQIYSRANAPVSFMVATGHMWPQST